MTGWTPEIVAERFQAAAITLRRSRAMGVGPSPVRVAWPEVLHDRREAYGYTAATAPRIQPSAAELSALDQVLQWSTRYLSAVACSKASLPSDAGWVLWQRAEGNSYQRICDMRARRWKVKVSGGNSREAVRQIEGQARDHVAAALNRDRIPLHVGLADTGDDPPPVLTGRGEAMPRAMDTRKFTLNERPCGECRFMVVADRMTRCGLLGGAVAPAMRAQHPENEPCFEPKPKVEVEE